MQLFIKISLDKPLTLPINYQHILQSVLYRLMGNADMTDLHDGGADYRGRKYKLFTFGPLKGKYKVQNRQITFFDEVSFEFRCVDKAVASRVAGGIVLQGISFGDDHFSNIEVKSSDTIVKQREINIRMVSPITVYSTDEHKKTHYYSPEMDEFAKAISMNFARKYEAYTGKPPKEEISITHVASGEKEKYLTRYKGFIIEGYMGEYRLKGTSEALTFLFNTGLGAKNSQGFGMFEII